FLVYLKNQGRCVPSGRGPLARWYLPRHAPADAIKEEGDRHEIRHQQTVHTIRTAQLPVPSKPAAAAHVQAELGGLSLDLLLDPERCGMMADGSLIIVHGTTVTHRIDASRLLHLRALLALHHAA